MVVKTNVALHSLKKIGRQLEESISVNTAVNIVIGCFFVLEQSPTLELREWLGRKPRRKKLKDPRSAVNSKQGMRAIQELVDLTISEFEASKTFRNELYVGPMPVKEPRKLPGDHVIALQLGRQKQRQRQAERAEVPRHRIAG